MKQRIDATLHQLQLFQAVVREEGFTRAAKVVHLSQPAVSIQVKRLEERVGLPLLEQVGNRTYPTEAGKAVYQASLDIHARLETLAESIDALRGEVGGTLNIIAVTSATYFLMQLVSDFLERYPSVEPRLRVTNKEAVYRSLAAHQDDVFVMGALPDGIQVEAVPFLENVLGIVAKPDHPLVGQRGIPMRALSEERVLLREEGSGSRRVLERLLATRGIQPRSTLELSGDEAVKQGVLAGLGIASLSLHKLHLDIEAGRLVVLDVEGFPLRRRWHVVTRKRRRLPRAAAAFVDFLQTQGEDLFQRHLRGEGSGPGSEG